MILLLTYINIHHNTSQNTIPHSMGILYMQFLRMLEVVRKSRNQREELVKACAGKVLVCAVKSRLQKANAATSPIILFNFHIQNVLRVGSGGG